MRRTDPHGPSVVLFMSMVFSSSAPAPLTPEHSARERRRYRPPVGVPVARARPWGLAVSLLAHAALLLLLIAVPALLRAALEPRGAGGPGPAGGGGGAGGPLGGAPPVAERVTYQTVAAAPPPPAPVPKRAETTVARAVVPPPVEAPKVVPPPVPVDTARAVSAVQPDSLVHGAGGAGAGGDSAGGGGTGPGTGGGVGTGTGPGRGSATGPGTGGGEGSIYPATPDVMILPPLPVPGRLHGREITLRFSIDSTGTITGIEFSPSGDDGYDRELRTRLMQYHFRPAHRVDGTPVASVFVIPLRL